ncbi:MAG: hypothetical protein IT353_03130 [Gemmatimonadaceae bacterium]|nr:hypothetical protein [Gemmatimonadaceae bacterium]
MSLADAPAGRTILTHFSREADGGVYVTFRGTEYFSEEWRTPVDFAVWCLVQQFPEGWYEEQRSKPDREMHPLARWYRTYLEFKLEYDRTPNTTPLASYMPGHAKAFVLLAINHYVLGFHDVVIAKQVRDLFNPRQFQGALYEICVLAGVQRANFSLATENESDNTKKHPEAIATHPLHPGLIAIEAKSIHRNGVFNFADGTPVPSLDRIDQEFVDFVVRQMAKQIEATIPKISDKAMFLFIDLNLPVQVAMHVVTQWQQKVEKVLNSLDPWRDETGAFIGRKINMITVSNLGLSSMDSSIGSSDFLHFYFAPSARECLHPLASALVPQLKAAFSSYGTYVEHDGIQ